MFLGRRIWGEYELFDTNRNEGATNRCSISKYDYDIGIESFRA